MNTTFYKIGLSLICVFRYKCPILIDGFESLRESNPHV